ncbi:hypothetical protein DY78_GL002370 [Lactiplantibacillus fabifermentans DSM 21115]|uniref:Prophage tail endopeptidase domain-containing protein n=2 Tax=Lactiplantibacillus fabifermentans TaxID=483011 RepID=A0A0R2NS11_9LACO|nr:hypothetical protein DY78_GL002370 [Lactiplantibacillus fabifermentans DSM 21115]
MYDSNLNETASYTLENHGIPYFGHTYTCQIEDTDNGKLWEDTNTFSVLNQYKPAADKNACMYFDWAGPDGRIYRYAVTNIADESGQQASGILPYTTFTGTNKLAFDLSGIDIDDKSWISPTLKEVAEYVLASSGWTIGECDSMNINTDDPTNFAISGAASAQDALSTMVTSFDCEIRAYIVVDQYGNVTQTVDLVASLQPQISSSYSTLQDESTDLYSGTASAQVGADTTQGRTIEYRAGLAGFERQEDRTAFYTRLYPTGENDVTVNDVNGDSPYVVDQDAQDYWLGANQPYRTLKIQNEYILNKSALLTWAQEQLKVYNHPAFTYTITTAFMDPDDMPMLGATNYIVNFDMLPALTVLAEVIELEIHDDAPTNNVVTYGEYRTLNPTTPALIAKMQSSLTSAIAKAQASADSIQPVIAHPDGLDFAQGDTSKRLILSAYEGTENISAYIDPLGFDWSRTDTNGLVDTTYAKTGYLNVIPAGTLGNIRGQIDGDYITDDPEISINDNTWAKFGSFDAYDNGVDEVMQHAEQLSDGRWITSQADCTYTLRDASLKYVSKMSVTNGGHGTSFGVTIEDGTIYIFAPLKTSAGYDLVKIPYTAGQTLDTDDVTHLLSFDHYIRVNYDATNDYFGLTDDSLNYYVLQGSDVRNGVDNILYQIALTDYGYDIDTQIYQGQLLDFPYVYFQSGNQNENDTCQIYAINLIHEGECFNYLYDFPDKLALTGYIEPEGLVFATINGTRVLMNCLTSTVGINTTPKTEYFYQVALTTRAPMTANSGTNDDSTDND